MSDFLSQLRAILEQHGMPGTSVRSVQIDIIARLGGSEVYVPRRLPDVRNARAQLIQAGIPPSTARYKVSGGAR